MPTILLRTILGRHATQARTWQRLTSLPQSAVSGRTNVGLDPQTRDHIWTYIRELKKTHDITIVLTTHYMDEADRLSDRIGIMDHGKIIALDTPSKLKETLEGDVVMVKASNIDELAQVGCRNGWIQRRAALLTARWKSRFIKAKPLCPA